MSEPNHDHPVARVLRCGTVSRRRVRENARWPRRAAGRHSAGMDDAFKHAVRLVEVFIFASAEPVAVSALARLVPMPYSAPEVLEVLRERCEGRGVELAEVGGCRSSLATSVRPLGVSVTAAVAAGGALRLSTEQRVSGGG